MCTIIVDIGPKPVKSRDSNKFCLLDWLSLLRFEKKIPHIGKGRREDERKVNDAAKCCKVSEVFTLVK